MPRYRTAETPKPLVITDQKRRSTSAEMRQRLDDVEQLMIRGVPRLQLYAWMRQRYGGIAEQTVRGYMRQVLHRIHERRAEMSAYDHDVMVERLERWMHKYDMRHNGAATARFAQQLIEVQGLRAPDRHVVSVQPALDVSMLSDEELQEFMRLYQKTQQKTIADTVATEAGDPKKGDAF